MYSLCNADSNRAGGYLFKRAKHIMDHFVAFQRGPRSLNYPVRSGTLIIICTRYLHDDMSKILWLYTF
jgi:hypothetical protein